ncbi:hypothetical protein A3F65_00920 [Candidatus Saccharibacteria bacterium RIFCSPHIGHO2_12_FULL_47_16b]|nr:MAG: hypothetical protein A3F65_00920 [Candidatus Saccharibacteria bacterium RIFCSPHIGHO2_12_FULL_47_16b]
MAVSIDQQFIEYIIKSLVGHPDDVKIERRIDEKGVLLELSVNPEDLGRVIGKRGSTAQSIRTLLRALGTKNDARYNLKIIDTGPPPEKRVENTEDREPVLAATAVATDDTAADDTAAAAEPTTPADDTTAPAEPAVAPTDEPAKTADVDMTEEEELPEKPKESHDDVISRTRKELADLDDLDV